MLLRFRTLFNRTYSQRFAIVSLCCLFGFALVISSRPVHASSPCPCHVFSASDPSTAPSVFNDGTGTELGMRFKPYVNGYITGIRFYKNVSMTDAHTGNLWDSTGGLLASGSFTNETSSGWQDLTFASPVSVTGGHYYTASYYTPAGKYTASSAYFSAATDNYPLIAPSSSTTSGAGLTGNGVYHSGSDAYPNTTFNSNNYWVDVTFRQTIDGSAPQVSSTNPANGSNNVFTASSMTATFNQNLSVSSVSSATAALTDSNNNVVPATISYDDTSKTIKITPTSRLTNDATYVATIRGGPSGVENLDGKPMAADYQWSFSTNDSCPCSIWNDGTLTNDPQNPVDSGPVELGERIHADESGFIETLRFYKPLNSTSTTHTLHIWTTGGTLLGTATTSHETNYGWQEAKLSPSVAITQGQDYVISYYAPDATYAYSSGVLTTLAGDKALHADANGSTYVYGGDSFPNNPSSSGWTYWIDAVLTSTDAYTAPFTVGVSQPAQAAYGVSTTAPLTFQMSNAVDASTVAGSVIVKDASNTTVPGTTTYDDSEHTLTFTPSSALSPQTRYTATLANGLKDMYGTAAASPYTLSFTTGAALSTNINQGMGGPVLVLTDASNPYDTYLAEILRTEGINYFTVSDISQISGSYLSNYKLVLLGKSSLTAAQTATLTTWVQNGGNLIAMQPDKQLASLLGLADKNQSLSEGYMKIDTSQSPGQGITAETMQYHGSADKYQTESARTVATLYQNATTSTTDPAVTENSYGSGTAAAFTYDLPESIALTHQGNPAWAGQERDGNTPIRPNDLFFGGAQTDWVNTSKAYIPQADEQQRLLVNMMLTMSQQHAPMPRFWILPHGYKSALVMVGDDHGTTSGTFTQFTSMLTHSAAGCSVSDWQCERAGSFLYTTSGLTSAQANETNAVGFNMGVHVSTGCGNYSGYSNLNSDYTSQIATFQAKYTGLPAQHTTRTHCYAWSDWDSTPKADIANGIHYNMNYVWYPPTWTGTNTGYLTGSGLTMRFTDANGNLLDDFQGVTDLDYETDPTSTSMNADLDNAIGTDAFYGVLGVHYDYSDSYGAMLMAAAEAHNVPMISPDQMLTWKDGLDSSTFTNISSSATKLDFTVQIAQGGEGAQAMVPASTSAGTVTSVKQNAQTVSYTTSTVKGITYAVFDAQPGSYEVQYGNAPTSPSNAAAAANQNALMLGHGAQDTIRLASITNTSPFSGAAAQQPHSGNAKPEQLSRQGSGRMLLGYIAGAVAVVGSIFVTLRLRAHHPPNG